MNAEVQATAAQQFYGQSTAAEQQQLGQSAVANKQPRIAILEQMFKATVQELMIRITAAEKRIQELEEHLGL